MKSTNFPFPQPTTPPEEQPAPVTPPRRRTFILPTFTGRVRRKTTNASATMALLFFATSVSAQTQPVQNNGTPTQQGTSGSMKGTQQPTSPQSQNGDGWMMFDDRVGKDLGLESDMLRQLRDVDGRYQEDYAALGTNPSKNAGYRNLSDHRNADVKAILSPSQYQRWSKMSDSNGQQQQGFNGRDGSMNPDGQNRPATTPRTSPSSTPAKPGTP